MPTTAATPLTTFLEPFTPLIHDQRTHTTFTAIIQGLLTAGTTICAQIAAHAPALAHSQYGERRVRRFVKGQTTQRSPDLDPDHLTATLREQTLARLRAQAPAEVWLILDGSELRKPTAHALPYLDKVPALDGHLVPGYWTLNVIAVVPGYRGVLYQRVYSTHEPGFRSEPWEVQQALLTVGPAVQAALPGVRIIWIMDRGFDDLAVWRTIWGLRHRVVCRLQHTDRLVQYRTAAGWRQGHLAAAVEHAPLLARVETTLEVRLRGQRAAKRQPVTVELRAGAVRLQYDRATRTEVPTGQVVQRVVWVVEVRILDCDWAPWILLADGPVATAPAVQQVFQMYRQRWSIEDSLKFTKTCLDWEAVQVLDLRGIRMLVALAWVAAGFLYEMGIGWEWEEVRLLARLGGWEERADRRPGRIVLTRGLARLLDMLTTEALLEQYRTEQGTLPARIAAFLRRGKPSDGL
jgi:hypothetical protein